MRIQRLLIIYFLNYLLYGLIPVNFNFIIDGLYYFKLIVLFLIELYFNYLANNYLLPNLPLLLLLEEELLLFNKIFIISFYFFK